MSKTLLTESEIRKMMKFANIGGLAENFIDQTIDEGYGMEEVDTLDEELDALEEEEDAEGDMGGDMDMEGADDDMDMEDEGDDMDMEDEDDDMDMEDEGDEPEGDMSAEVQIDEDDLPALQTARDILDQILQAEGGGDDMDMEDEGDEPEGDEEPMEEGMYEEDEGMSEEDIMEEVARRVAKRLLETKNKG